MLKVLREKTKSLHWVLWLIIASFLLLTFVEWGGAGSVGRSAATAVWAAKVGDRTVPADRFRVAYQSTESFYRDQLGASYRRGMFFQPEDILNDLVDEVLLEGEAERLGLTATPAEIAASIRSRADLRGAGGTFDRSLYQRLLSYNGLSPAEFEAREGLRIQVRKLDDLQRSAVAVADEDLRRTWMDRNQSVSIRYALVPTESFTGEVEVEEEALLAYYQEHVDDYDAGPGRRIRWVRFDREAARAAFEDEAQMREYYETNRELLYTMGPELRRARQILVSVPAGAPEDLKEQARARAEELAARARSGEDFAALASAESDDAATRERGGDMDAFLAGTHEPAFDDAVFAAAEGEILGPLETSAGFRVVLVTKGEGTKARPYEEVKEAVSRGLYSAQAVGEVRDQLERFQTAVAEGKDFSAAAAAAGLEASAETWVSQGAPPADGPGPVAIQTAFDLGVGDTSGPVSAPGGQVVLQVLEARESSPRSFDDAREAVESDFRSELARELALAEAERLRSLALTEGLEAAAAASDLDLRTASALRKRGSVPGLGVEPALNEAAMATPVDSVGPVVPVASGALVFEVTERKDFDAEVFAADRETLRREIQGARFQTLRRANLQVLRQRLEGSILMNDDLLEPLRERNPLG